MRGHGCRLAAALLLGWVHLAADAADLPKLPPLTTVSGSPRLPGKFVWADLVTDNVPAAKKFYEGLFGWQFYDYGGYLIAHNADRPVAGLFQRPRPADRPEAKPRWFGYISVSDVGRTLAKVEQGGGRVLAPAAKQPKRGEQAVLADPEGAVFGVIRSSSGDPEDFQAEPGDWMWIQLLSRNGEKAGEFYRSFAGYEIIPNEKAGRLSDFVLASEGYARATIRTLPASRTDVPPGWLLFVRVDSVAASVARAGELGGKVLLAPRPDLLDGQVAVLADPTGAAVGIMEWPQGLTKGGR
ncbi:MAG: VOC family protein [Limisphaerales bacterium]